MALRVRPWLGLQQTIRRRNVFCRSSRTRTLESSYALRSCHPINGFAQGAKGVRASGTSSSAPLSRAGEGTCGVQRSYPMENGAPKSRYSTQVERCCGMPGCFLSISKGKITCLPCFVEPGIISGHVLPPSSSHIW